MTERGSSNKIREQMRKESVDDRQLHRQLAVNQARKNLGETAEELQVLNVTTQAKFTDILAKLKKRNNTSHLDLRSLKQGLQDPANSKVFLRSTGALPAVIGHLTGKKALHQLEAAYICCNLATGEDFQCISVANAAGPYLIEFLNGPNTALHVASIWTLGNLAGGSSKSRNILLSQGLLPRLLSCLKSPLPEVVEASLNAFILILKSTINEKQSSRFTSETSQQIATIVLQLPCCRVEVAWLIFLLSCTPECDNLLNGQNELDSFISKLSEVSRNSPLKVEDLSTLRFITAIVRTLANLSSAEDGEAALRILAHPMLPMILNDFLHASHTHLRLETEWLTTNLLSHPSGVVAKQSQAIKLDAVLNAKGNDHSKIEIIISGV